MTEELGAGAGLIPQAALQNKALLALQQQEVGAGMGPARTEPACSASVAPAARTSRKCAHALFTQSSSRLPCLPACLPACLQQDLDKRHAVVLLDSDIAAVDVWQLLNSSSRWERAAREMGGGGALVLPAFQLSPPRYVHEGAGGGAATLRGRSLESAVKNAMTIVTAGGPGVAGVAARCRAPRCAARHGCACRARCRHVSARPPSLTRMPCLLPSGRRRRRRQVPSAEKVCGWQGPGL